MTRSDLFVLVLDAGCAGFEPLEAERETSRVFVESAARDSGARQTASGLVIRTVTRGNGESPSATDRVTVHYTGTRADGTVFDSSLSRGPATFPLSGVIKCWT